MTAALPACRLLLFGGCGVLLVLAARGSDPVTAGVAGAVFLVAIVAGIAGFAFSALCGPVLYPLLGDPVRIIIILLVASTALQFLTIWELRQDIRLRRLLPPVLAGLATLPLGVLLLLGLPPGRHGALLGGLLVGYGCLTLLRPVRHPVPERLRLPGLLLAGALGGITGGIAAFPSALLVIWCGRLGLSKAQQRAVFQPYIVVMQIANLGLLSVLAPLPELSANLGQGEFALAAPPWFGAGDLLMVLPALAGGVIGLRLFRRMTDRGFAQLVQVLLILAGLGMLL